MMTTIDKALVALVLSLLSLLNLAFGIDLGVNPEVVSALVAAVTPVLVWVIPNRDQ
jgi:hypothetical protein